MNFLEWMLERISPADLPEYPSEDINIPIDRRTLLVDRLFWVWDIFRQYIESHPDVQNNKELKRLAYEIDGKLHKLIVLSDKVFIDE